MTDDDREAWALFRYRLISPLVDPVCSRAERTASRAYLQAHPPRDPHGPPGVPSVRTLERDQQAYRTGGFDALRPPRRAECGARRTIPTACGEQACRLQREVPERSAAQVLALLAAWAPTVGIDPAVIARIRPSTLSRHGQQAGITRRQLWVAAPQRYRRWEAPTPGALWQSDVMGRGTGGRGPESLAFEWANGPAQSRLVILLVKVRRAEILVRYAVPQHVVQADE
jgi:putative transposase